jgi:hypothetical protein
MHVHDVEPMVFDDLDEARGQSQRVRRVLQRRMGGNGDLVQEETLDGRQGTAGRRARDHVHAVAPKRQAHRELGRDDAAPAQTGEAHDPDGQGRAHRSRSTMSVLSGSAAASTRSMNARCP